MQTSIRGARINRDSQLTIFSHTYKSATRGQPSFTRRNANSLTLFTNLEFSVTGFDPNLGTQQTNVLSPNLLAFFPPSQEPFESYLVRSYLSRVTLFLTCPYRVCLWHPFQGSIDQARSRGESRPQLHPSHSITENRKQSPFRSPPKMNSPSSYPFRFLLGNFHLRS